MARPTRERTQRLLQTIYDLLKDRKTVIHYKLLTKVLLESGLWPDPWGEEPSKTLYNAVFAHFRANGKDGMFLLFARGFLCTTNVPGAEFYDQNVAMPTQSRPRPKKEKPPVVQKCGNCNFLSWRGPNLHSHEIGSCRKHKDSKRAQVYKNSEPCPFWKQRTQQRINSDRFARASVVGAIQYARQPK